MQLIDFKLVTTPELSGKDYANIQKAVASDPLGQDVDTVLNAVDMGHALMWRWETGSGSGMLFTQECRWGDASELFVWYIGGKDIAPHGRYVSDVLEEFCRLRGLNKITALVKPSMEKYLSQFGYNVERYLVSKEVPNGRRRDT